MNRFTSGAFAIAVAALGSTSSIAYAASQPNIVMIVADDFGYGDAGAYGGGEGRGMPTPNIDKLAHDGMQFYDYYAQPSCTAGRAAMLTGRFPNRSGMTTVAFQGQGGGLPAAEWTLASVLKTAGYATYFTGKWHLGEADYAMPTAQGFDEMKAVGLYHLNAYTYGDPKWFPAMDPEIRAMFNRVTKGALEGKAGSAPTEMFKINGEYVNTPVIDGKEGVVGIPFLDRYVEAAAIEYLEKGAANARAGKPFFLSVNFMKVHQPNLPDPDFIDKSLSKTKFADSVVEVDNRIGRVMAKLKELGLDNNTLVIFTTDNGAWQDVYPDAGYTPFRGTKGTVREGGNRVPMIAVWPGHIAAGAKSHEIMGGTDFMATFAAAGGAKLPVNDREGKPIIFDSFDMMPLLTGQVTQSPRKSWFYFTENELSPGAIRLGHLKMVFNLRGDNGAVTGGLSVDSNLGWKGPEKYVAVVPQLFDLWQDPQERYDVVMNAWGDNTWVAAIMNPEIGKLMKTYVQYPPRKLQSAVYTGPITITNYQKFQYLRDTLAKDGISLGMPN
jgi:arylsulfatase